LKQHSNTAHAPNVINLLLAGGFALAHKQMPLFLCASRYLHELVKLQYAPLAA
jgi:hypothetical protein